MDIKGTTIVAVQKDGKCALAGDGQVTLGEATIMKHTADTRQVSTRVHTQKTAVQTATAAISPPLIRTILHPIAR